MLQKYCFQLPDKWLQNQYRTDHPLLAMMAEVEEWEIWKRTLNVGDNDDLRLWTMVYSPVQQVLQLDVGLYTVTVCWRADGDHKLFGCLEPTWAVEGNITEGTISYISHPSGAMTWTVLNI